MYYYNKFIDDVLHRTGLNPIILDVDHDRFRLAGCLDGDHREARCFGLGKMHGHQDRTTDDLKHQQTTGRDHSHQGSLSKVGRLDS